jgi:hypothetical protein
VSEAIDESAVSLVLLRIDNDWEGFAPKNALWLKQRLHA